MLLFKVHDDCVAQFSCWFSLWIYIQPPCFLYLLVGTGSAELLEIQRAAEFGNVLWISSVALVLHSGLTSHLGSPSAFLYSWLCAGPKKVPAVSNGHRLDSVSIQVISLMGNFSFAACVLL